MTERETYLLNQRAKALLASMADMKKSITYDRQDGWNDAAAHMCRTVKELCPNYLGDKAMVIGMAVSGGLTGYAVEKMPERLRRDHEVAATIFNCRVELLESDRKDFLAPFTDDKGLMLAALDAGAASYSDVSPRLRADADIAVACIDRNDPANSLSQFPPDLFHDPEFVISTMEKVDDPTDVEPFIPDDVRQDPTVQAFLEAAKDPASGAFVAGEEYGEPRDEEPAFYAPPGPSVGYPAPSLDAMIASAQSRAGTDAENRGHVNSKAAER